MKRNTRGERLRSMKLARARTGLGADLAVVVAEEEETAVATSSWWGMSYPLPATLSSDLYICAQTTFRVYCE